MVFGDLKLETTSERGSSTALMNRWRMAGTALVASWHGTGPTLVSEKLDQAAEIPRELNVDLSPKLVRETRDLTGLEPATRRPDRNDQG